MSLIVIYVVLVVIGEIVAVELGLYLDTALPTFSLPIAVGLFFSVLVGMWPIAVAIYDRFLGSRTVAVAAGPGKPG